MATYFSEFFLLWSVFMLGAMVPGADMIMIIRNTITGGRLLGILTALGTAIAIGVHCTYATLGIGIMLAESPVTLKVIQYFGAAFLMFLGTRLWQQSFVKRKTDITIDRHAHAPSLWKGFQTGFIIDLLNPFAALYLISLLTTEISDTTPLSIRILYVTGLTISDFIFMLSISLVLSHEQWRHIFFRHTHWVNRLSGTVLLIIGIKFLIT